MRLRQMLHTITFRQIALLIIPITLCLGFTIVQLPVMYAPLVGHWLANVLVFGAMASIAVWLNHKYVRWIISTSGLVILLYLLLQSTTLINDDIFKYYSVIVQCRVLATFAVLGWFTGFLVSRFAWGIYIISAIALYFGISIVQAHPVWDLWQQYAFPVFTLTINFLPFIVVVIYLIGTQHRILHYARPALYIGENRFWRKQLVYVSLLGIVFAILSPIVYWSFGSALAQIESQSAKNDNSMLKNSDQDKQPPQEASAQQSQDDKKTLNDFLKLGSKNNRGKKLLFLAYIDNFFEDGQTPNPLYLSMYYYGKFNEKDETFLIDTTPPNSDLFLPKIDQLALYQTNVDSQILAAQQQYEFTKMVNTIVYKKNVAPELFTAPSVAYAIQPIAVDPMYRNEFYAAYEAKSNVSSLNSAYFVYNDDSEIVRQFQEQRNVILRGADQYAITDSTFYQYYTSIPSGKNFDSIANLAQTITAAAHTTIDKVLAIRDFFWEKDATGKRIYTYSDNPGIPELPSASRLNHFLFKEKKGYCAYYAGATLYMLRSLGIPSRIVGGFLTEDRSKGKNAGWYSLYEDQAHAWVQVFFPGLGWIDFDTTVDNDDARESEQADGTPPVIPKKPILAIQASIKEIDTLAKNITLKFDVVSYKDEMHKVSLSERKFDVSNTLIKSDFTLLSWADLSINDSIIALNFDVTLKAHFPNVEALLNADSVLAINEIHVYPKKAVADEKLSKASQSNTFWNHSIVKVALWLALILGLVVGIFWPYWRMKYWVYRVRKSITAADRFNVSHRILMWLFRSEDILDMRLTLAEQASLFTAKTGIDISAYVKAYNGMKYGATDFILVDQDPLIMSILQQYLKQQSFKNLMKTLSIF